MGRAAAPPEVDAAGARIGAGIEPSASLGDGCPQHLARLWVASIHTGRVCSAALAALSLRSHPPRSHHFRQARLRPQPVDWELHARQHSRFEDAFRASREDELASFVTQVKLGALPHRIEQPVFGDAARLVFVVLVATITAPANFVDASAPDTSGEG